MRSIVCLGSSHTSGDAQWTLNWVVDADGVVRGVRLVSH